MDRSIRTDQTNGLVGRYVANDSFANRSLRSDRPSGLVGCYVATEWLGRLLRSDRHVRGYRLVRGSVAT
ncbi:hypothetical protein F2Q69_00035792 [Brassica cretica]|uniref:Uncharacterized protein n=1 Tax=Brassica cretica TaxID=69181 RepID=A0A8S9ST99_BRACR|nr:hypothetical protein F2Q69_00035792 [Brassica cretica]